MEYITISGYNQDFSGCTRVSAPSFHVLFLMFSGVDSSSYLWLFWGSPIRPPISLKYFELSPPRSLGCALLGVLKWEHEMHLFVWRPPHLSGSGHLQVLPGVKVCTFSPKVSPEFVTLHTCLSCICTYTVLPVDVFYCQERFILLKNKKQKKTTLCLVLSPSLPLHISPFS